jgi:hypothetical protein
MNHNVVSSTQYEYDSLKSELVIFVSLITDGFEFFLLYSVLC